MATQETIAVLERCANVTNDPKGRKKAVNLLTKGQRDSYEREKRAERGKVEKGRIYKVAIDEGASNRRIREIDMILEDQSPDPNISPDTRDALDKREKELREQILEGMVPKEVMRRNPPGAVGMHQRWEKPNKPRLLEWKNIARQLDPYSEDKDLSNFEKFRPEIGAANGSTIHMTDAQIHGHHAMSPAAKDNWPEGLGEGINSALDQVQAAENKNPEALPALLCACGCGEMFIPATKIQKFKDRVHRLHNKNTNTMEPRECQCGCREFFTPKNRLQKFINKEHKIRHNTKKETDAREQVAAGDEFKA